MKTLLDREREAVHRILVALEDLPLHRQRDVVWRMALLYGCPLRLRGVPAKRRRVKDPSPEGSFSMPRIGVRQWEALPMPLHRNGRGAAGRMCFRVVYPSSLLTCKSEGGQS